MNIRQNGVHSYTSDIYHASLPENILICTKECSLKIKKYIKDNQVFEVEDLEMLPVEESNHSSVLPFDADTLLQTLSQFKGSQDMIKYLKSSDLDQSSELFLAILQALNKRFQFERFYGPNQKTTLDEVKKVIDEYQSSH